MAMAEGQRHTLKPWHAFVRFRASFSIALLSFFSSKGTGETVLGLAPLAQCRAWLCGLGLTAVQAYGFDCSLPHFSSRDPRGSLVVVGLSIL